MEVLAVGHGPGCWPAYFFALHRLTAASDMTRQHCGWGLLVLVVAAGCDRSGGSTAADAHRAELECRMNNPASRDDAAERIVLGQRGVATLPGFPADLPLYPARPSRAATRCAIRCI